VVPRESPASWPAEALKAQAVAARSYAYQDAKDGRTIYCTTMSQVYNGFLGPKGGESASTNKAIDDTKGEVVWYGSQTKPVKTFFFSSSGGHTASIQDGWTSSAPPPYYRGVNDADSDGNPYYKWTAGPFGAAEISSKVRAKVGSASSAPSPHTITGMSLDRASSGFARYATIRWSDGSSYKIRGDSLRSALGLRSTKFSVTVKSPVTKYQQTSSKFAQSGIWSTVSSSKASGGSYARTSRYSSQFVARFKGTGITWIGAKSSKLGKAEVIIDGRRVAVIDQYAPSAKYKQTLYATTGLPAGEHTVVIKAIKSKDRRSKAYGATVDRIYVIGGSLLQADTPVYRYEEHDGRIAELGGWTTTSSAEYSGGKQIVNARAGSSIYVDFIGTNIAWVGSKGPDHGSAKVSIDGGTPITVSLNAAQAASQQTLFTSQKLTPNRTHRLRIDVIGHTSGGTGLVSVDRIFTTGGWMLKPTLPSKKYQQTQVNKTGYWKTNRSSAFSGGSHMYAAKAGKQATFEFEGTSVKWYGTKSPRYGKAAVYLDGVRVATVDSYASKTGFRKVLYRKTGLSAKKHTLTIKALGKKRSSAKGTRVSVDAIIVAGLKAP
jgi:SpoIID/LytB domain protein